MHSAIVEDPHYWRNWIGLCVLGCINNIFYVVVNSAAQNLCNEFNAGNWIGAILWCNIAFGLVARIINTFWLESISHGIRVFAAGLASLIGLLGIPGAIMAGQGYFWLLLIAVTFIGTASSFGESVLLGYQKRFPATIVNGWSSGTGWAGVIGAALYLLFVAPFVNLSDQQSFLILTPLVLVYWGCFYWVMKPPFFAREDDDYNIPILSPQVDVRVNEVFLDKDPVEKTSSKFMRCLRLVWWVTINLLLVYLFEYIASTGGSDVAEKKDYKTDPDWFIRNAYVILNFCYQAGVLISRSSLPVMKIRRVEVLTVLQFVNMIFWILQGRLKIIEGSVGVWFQFLLMVYVGLLGGAAYVNIFYLVLHNKEIVQHDKEECINIVALSNTFGIMLAAAFIILLDYTVWAGMHDDT